MWGMNKFSPVYTPFLSAFINIITSIDYAPTLCLASSRNWGFSANSTNDYDCSTKGL